MCLSLLLLLSILGLIRLAVDAFYTLSNTRGQIQSYVFDGMDV